MDENRFGVGLTRRPLFPSSFLPLLQREFIPYSSSHPGTRLMDEGYTVDFAKAFDSIDRQFLLAKLKSLFIGGSGLNWAKPSLSGRSYRSF